MSWLGQSGRVEVEAGVAWASANRVGLRPIELIWIGSWLASGCPSPRSPRARVSRVNAKLLGQFLLAHPQRATHLDDMLPEALALSRERDVPEELDDSRDEVESWRGMPLLPVGYRGGVDAKPLGNILLKQTQIKTLLSEMILQRTQFFRIGW